jgi:hypothetical protein
LGLRFLPLFPILPLLLLPSPLFPISISNLLHLYPVVGMLLTVNMPSSGLITVVLRGA